jgi:hypothetical protein
MTTPIAQTSHDQPTREKLPPVERSDEQVKAPSSTSPQLPEDDLVAPAPSVKHSGPQPTERQKAMGKWIYEHRHATDGFAGYMGYQIVRNMLAAVPYAFATAGVWLGFQKAHEWGQNNAVAKKMAQGMEAKAALDAVKLAPTLGMRFAASPARDIAMIAAGFTFYRGTLKVVRFMKERLFNPHHSEEQSIQEVQNFGQNLKDTIHEVSPAEAASTPVAAFALGLGRRLWNPAEFLKPLGEEAAKHKVTGMFKPGFEALKVAEKAAGREYTRWQHIKNVFSKPGGYLVEAGIVAASFVPFFELGDRRYKDAQVSRGIWLNDPSSLVRKSDEQAKRELDENAVFASASPHQDKLHDQMAKKSAESMKATGHLRPADPPTFTCFAMRRVVPTFLGIGAYVAGKRLAYLGMGNIPENYDAAAKGFGGFLKNLGKISLIEGAATSLFWLNSSVIDKYEPWYDKNFKDSKPKPLTDEQIRRHYEELKARLDAKERDRAGSQTTVA